MNKSIGLLLFLIVPGPLARAQPNTYFATGFEYSTEPASLLEAYELNGAVGQVGMWSGDDFPEADALGFFSGGVTGGDSAGFVANPYGGRMLLIDRPIDKVVHFLNLTQTIPTAGATVGFTTGIHTAATGGFADYEWFGLDPDGNESFRIRVGTIEGRQRIGFHANDRLFFDLPTVVGFDQNNDLMAADVPLSVGDDMADITLTLGETGYVIDFANRNHRNGYRTGELPYNGSATELSRIGLSYGGVFGDAAKQSGVFLDDVRVTTGEEPPEPPPGTLLGTITDEQKVALTGSGQRVVGLLFESEAGLIIPVPPGDTTGDVSPWEVLLANTPNTVALGSLGNPVAIDGELVTAVGYSGTDPPSDLVAYWANEENVRIPIPVRIAEPAPLSGFIDADGKIVVEGSGKEIIGLDFVSPAGQLIPIPPGDLSADPAPFQAVLANGPTQVTLGTIGAPVGINGQLVTRIGYAGLDPEGDLIAKWGADGASHEFSITRGDVALDCNGDGVVDANDLTCICGSDASIDDLLRATDLIAGDLNADGAVLFFDFTILSLHFGRVGDYTDGDINCSGTIDFDDFVILAANFNQTSAAAVPEPTGAALLVISIVASCGLGRRDNTRLCVKSRRPLRRS